MQELIEIEKLAEQFSHLARINIEETVTYKNTSFPILSFSLGQGRATDPTLLLVGGVHGLERIGTQIIISYLKTVLELAAWDESFTTLLRNMRILFYPLVNPGGMFWHMRSNPNGVDLMRNAPVEADKKDAFPLVGGHRISSKLPWYMGKAGDPMEKEAAALCRFVKRELFDAQVAVSLDVHSGFGLKDRLWFPFARSKKPFDKVCEAYLLSNLLNRTYPNHIYQFEPQSLSYVTNGDLWDHLFDEHKLLQMDSQKLFMPLSLELGSWLWVKKNPRQIFSSTGAFNPVLPHRLQRAFRSHLVLFDFLVKATNSSGPWANPPEAQRSQIYTDATEHWYTHGRNHGRSPTNQKRPVDLYQGPGPRG